MDGTSEWGGGGGAVVEGVGGGGGGGGRGPFTLTSSFQNPEVTLCCVDWNII